MGSVECFEGRERDFPFLIRSADGKRRAFLKGGQLLLFEWKIYEVKTKKPCSAVHIRGVEKAERDVFSEDVFWFSFKNHIGYSKLVFDFEGGKLEIPVLVLSEKLCRMRLEDGEVLKDPETTEDMDELCELVERLIERFHVLCEALTRDISRLSTALNFSLVSPTAFPVIESVEPVNELFAYHFFRMYHERIVQAFEAILRRIRKELVERIEWVDVCDVDELTPDVLISLVHQTEYAVSKGNSALTRRLKGRVPTKALSLKKYESFDTPENRFVKYFLDLLIEWGQRVVDRFEKEIVECELRTVRGLLEDLRSIRNDWTWSDVGEMREFPRVSPLFLKNDGYRELMELYGQFTSYAPFFEELQRAIENGEITKLYEYWAFLKLAEELGKVLGRGELRIATSLERGLVENGASYVEFANGWRLYYNLELSPKSRRSYSVPLRPDFSLFTGDASNASSKLVGVFDAKFKVNAGDPAEAGHEDIHKMHAYRDALKCEFAVVIYPGTASRMFFETFDPERSGSSEEDTSSLLQLFVSGSGGGVGYLGFIPRE